MKILLLRFYQRKGALVTIPWHYSFFKDILEAQGHTVDIMDNQIEEYSVKELVDLALKNEYQLVGTGGIGTVYNPLKAFSALLKSKKPQLPVVVGGQIVADYQFIINSCAVDILVLREGEKTLLKIANCIEQNGDLHTVPGIVYKNGDEIVVTEREKFISMDELPEYNFQNLKIDKYNTKVGDQFLVDEKAISLKESGQKFLGIFLARGCPHQCFFCYRQIKGYRVHSRERVEKIFKGLKEKGFSFFYINDECITANRKNLEHICYLGKKYDFYWFSNGRVDQVTPETLKMLKQSNCVGIQYGVESFDERMLNAMYKKTSVEQNIDVTNLNYQYGLQAVLQLIIGTPGEDRKSILNTRKGMWRCYFKVDRIANAILNPYPGSKAYYYGLEKGYIKDKEYVHSRFSDKGEIVVNFSKLTLLELLTWQKWLPVEAAISYRIKQSAFLINRGFLAKTKAFIKGYLKLLFKEPVNFLFFNLYLFRGFSYWLKPVTKLKWAERYQVESK